MTPEAGRRVACVVVTRDRQELLRECLHAVLGQTAPVESVIAVDNASSDGTPRIVRKEFPEVELISLEENTGGAGGFATGVQAALEKEVEWLWLLDDDTIPRSDALEQLLACRWAEAGLPQPSLLASRVDAVDGNPHPLNAPMMRRRDPDALAAAAAAGLLAVRSSTFVSLLVPTRVVRQHGGPRRAFFFQADDIEFTARLLRDGHGYLVPQSVVEHRSPPPLAFVTDPFRFYFHVRNTVFMIRGEAWDVAERASLCWLVIESSGRFLLANRFSPRSLVTVVRAVAHGLAHARTP